MGKKPCLKFLMRWLLLGLCALGFSVTSAVAQVALPSADVLPEGVWDTMHKGTFEPTAEAAEGQYVRSAFKNKGDRLTEPKRQLMTQMLDDGLCPYVEGGVPDGIVFSLLNARRKGEPTVLSNIVKKTGAAEEAQLCDLGDGVYAYRFTGEDRSCNNVGFVFKKKPTPPPPVPKLVWVCKETSTDNSIPASTQYLQGFTQEDCCCSVTVPGLALSSGGVQSTSYDEDCRWETKN